MWASILRSVVAFLLLLAIARWGVRRRLGKFGVFEVLAVNAMGDLTSHLAFETQDPLSGGVASVTVFAAALVAVEIAGARPPLLPEPPACAAQRSRARWMPRAPVLAQARLHRSRSPR